MTIDPEKLLAFSIPQAEQVITPRDVALYALSVGVGQDPLCMRELSYVDPLRGPRVMPSMALVLAHPGFWLGQPDSGVDPASVLHADQEIEILSPLPATGLIRSSTRITGLVDKGLGKAALLRTETVLEGKEGQKLARLSRTTYLRGGGGFGGNDEPSAARPAPPEGPPLHLVRHTTREEQALLYRLNGDLNPLHSDPAVAQRAGFSRPILHGLCTAGVVCRALLRTLVSYEEERLTGLRLRFAAPVMPGETLITEIWANGRFRTRVEGQDRIAIDDGQAIFSSSPATADKPDLSTENTVTC